MFTAKTESTIIFLTLKDKPDANHDYQLPAPGSNFRLWHKDEINKVLKSYLNDTGSALP